MSYDEERMHSRIMYHCHKSEKFNLTDSKRIADGVISSFKTGWGNDILEKNLRGFWISNNFGETGECIVCWEWDNEPPEKHRYGYHFEQQAMFSRGPV